jgi:hypothetical protein
MKTKLSAETRKRLLVSFCTLICSGTAMIGALAPFGHA